MDSNGYQFNLLGWIYRGYHASCSLSERILYYWSVADDSSSYDFRTADLALASSKSCDETMVEEKVVIEEDPRVAVITSQLALFRDTLSEMKPR